MCRFKSGIIFKGRSVVSPGENDSHSDLLEELGVEDTQANAMTKFVRAELIPPNDEWWTDPDTWEMHVDQDILPDWFDLDRDKYEQEFRDAVKSWWEKHVLVDQKVEELSSGYYRLKRCEVKRLCNDVRVLLDESQVGVMRESSQVGVMRGNSQVGEMWESSQVGVMWESSQVGVMRGNSQVGEMWESSQVGVMWESSQVGVMRGNSQVGEMWESSQVGVMWESSQVGEMWESSQVGEMWGSSTARDFKEYPKVKIMIPEDGNFELVRKPKEDKQDE